MEECPELFEGKKELTFNEITKYLNCLGGGIQLSFMKRDFFLNQLLLNKNLLRERIGERALKQQESLKNVNYSESTVQRKLTAEEPYTDYINIRNTVASMIDKSNQK